MKSLQTISEIITKWPELKTTLNTILENDTNNSLQIEGVHGSLFSYFTKELITLGHFKSLHAAEYASSSKHTPLFKTFSNDLIIVVPTETDAIELNTDLHTIFPEADISIFPAWGTVPYRPVAQGSITFGKRAGILTKLLEKNTKISFEASPRIFIFTQRSFMSPLPDPSYLKTLSFKLRKGDSLDTAKVAEKLVKNGYIRVPKVTVRGEFSLRGEVLDIFLPSDDNATRIIFDFDEIEAIKSFEADSQSSIGDKVD